MDSAWLLLSLRIALIAALAGLIGRWQGETAGWAFGCMGLLLLQAASELIKRAAFLRGLIPDPLAHGHASHPDESELEREIEEHAAHANEEVR